MSVSFNVNGKYSFEVYPATILGNNFKNVTVLGIVHASVAQSFLDLEATHVQVYPYLPDGTPDNARGYDYLMLKTASGQTTVIGIPWINQDTIAEVESGTMIVEIAEVTSQDIQRVSDSLALNGYQNVKITMKT